ncbi:MAG TPA: hypothetical protein VFH91_08455 [Pyrinomonadaceae bacterium]|nr:hypothetical protein [Pyrinomonadaceae bacterium]
MLRSQFRRNLRLITAVIVVTRQPANHRLGEKSHRAAFVMIRNRIGVRALQRVLFGSRSAMGTMGPESDSPVRTAIS